MDDSSFLCPSCGLELPAGPTAPPTCPRCRLPLVGALAEELGAVDRELAVLDSRSTALRRRRADLLARLRAFQPGGSAGRPYSSAFQPFDLGPQPATPGRLPIQSTLLGLGALLLSVAGVIFTALAWGQLGITGRAGILLAVTAVSAGSVVALHRRGLPASADAVGVVTVVLVALDLHAVRLLAVPQVDVFGWWSFAAGLLTALAAGGGLRLRLPVLTAVAAVVGQLVLPLAAAASLSGTDTDLREATVLLAVALTGTACLDLTLFRGTGTAGWANGARALLRTAGLAELAVAGLSALGAALVVDSTDQALPGVGALLLVAAAFAYAAVLADGRLAPFAAGASAAALLGAGQALTLPSLDPDRVGSSVALLVPATLGLLLAAAGRLLPARFRAGPLLVGATATTLATLGADGEMLAGLAAPLTLLADPWPALPPADAAAVLTLLDHPVTVGLADSALLVLTAAVLTLLNRNLRAIAAVTLAGAALLLPPALGLPVPVTVTAVLLVVAALAWSAVGSRGPRSWEWQLLLAVPFAVTALSLSLSSPALTLIALAVLAAVTGAVARGGWPAQTLACTPVATGLALAIAPVATLAAGAEAVAAGAVLAAVAAVVLLAVDRNAPSPERAAVVATAVGAAVIGTGLTGTDPTWLAAALTGLGLAALAGTFRPGRYPLAVLGGVLFTAAGWVRLADADVTVPEAYTAPPALLALVVGELLRRRQLHLDPVRRIDPTLLLGPGLSLALLPSLLATFSDAGALRPALLTVAAFATVVGGSTLRLRAPLVLGGLVLGAVALRHLGPLAADAPRWMLLGSVGLVLLVLGARYERTRDEVDRLRRSFAELG